MLVSSSELRASRFEKIRPRMSRTRIINRKPCCYGLTKWPAITVCNKTRDVGWANEIYPAHEFDRFWDPPACEGIRDWLTHSLRTRGLGRTLQALLRYPKEVLLICGFGVQVPDGAPCCRW
jgi:hypothetical protein